MNTLIWIFVGGLLGLTAIVIATLAHPIFGLLVAALLIVGGLSDANKIMKGEAQ